MFTVVSSFMVFQVSSVGKIALTFLTLKFTRNLMNSCLVPLPIITISKYFIARSTSSIEIFLSPFPGSEITLVTADISKFERNKKLSAVFAKSVENSVENPVVFQITFTFLTISRNPRVFHNISDFAIRGHFQSESMLAMTKLPIQLNFMLRTLQNADLARLIPTFSPAIIALG